MNTFKIFAPTMIASRDADGKMRIEGVASSTVRDSHGDQLTRRALEKMAASAKGLTIFLNHEYRVPEDVFGTVEKVRLERTGQIDAATNEEIFDLRMGIVVQQKNKRAVEAFEQMEPGPDRLPTRLGLSIGAMIPEGGAKFDKSKGGRYIVDDIDLVETSLVSMPANPRSWVDYAVKSLSGKLPNQLRKGSADLLAEVLAAEGVAVIDSVDEEELVPDPEPVTEATEETEEASGEDEAPEDDPTADHTAPTEDDAPATADTKARVTVWDGDKVIEVDTGRSKPKTEDLSAQAEPENAGSPEGATKSLDLDEDAAAEQAVVVTLKSSERLILSLRGQIAAKEAEIDAIREERDAAVQLAKMSVEGTQQVLEKLAELPAGRKTGFVEVQKEFDTIRDDIYDADFRKLLLKK